MGGWALLNYSTVRKIEKNDGDIAEVGIYKGRSAKLIHEASMRKPMYLFDTFEGLPNLSEKDNPEQFQKGNYSASLEIAKNYLKKYSNIYFYKGLFPDTAEPIKDRKFSFVHLDVDIYESMLNSLKFFYPRMNSGGIIMGHDYPDSDGVKKAFEEFFKDKPEIISKPYLTSYALIVKV